MVAKLGGPEGLLGGFLAAYFVLLLFCFSVSNVQGGVLLYLGLTSWCVVASFFSVGFYVIIIVIIENI